MPEYKKIALITGANKGIGFEVSRQVAKTGVRVLIGARNAELGEKAAEKLRGEGLDVAYLPIDVTDEATIKAAAAKIEKDYGHLDILVNNAGIADLQQDGAPSKVQQDTLEKTMRTNFFGHVAVSQAMLPLLKKAPSARVVNVSSGLGSLALNSDPAGPYYHIKPLAYNASKAALNMFTVHLAYELRDTKIKVNSSDPGYTATDLNANSGPQTIEEGSEETIRLALLPDDGPTGGYFDRHGPVAW
ncbi:SDR family oxidoreductase [Silvibacterium acidisoli]|uniref:SDR family oxidoreductase n=1 Tax=Acidobacteriaceae bacterium ZG23-2 TaxID=2883246 RepID=UPI00406C6D22